MIVKVMKQVNSLNDYVNKNIGIQIIVLCLYIILLCVVSYFHEGWHDEGQAWLIARDDTLWHLIRYTTHWEGHPPLWHLILMPFAKAGLSFQFGLKLINIVICSLAMGLMILKSRLPWYFRFTLPFTYFCFYQYGVVSRPYSLMMFSMMLAAYYYQKRQEKPYHEAISLAIVSGSQAYGMMLALGIAIAWAFDIIKTDIENGCLTLSNIWKNKQSKALLLLFGISFVWALTMVPLKETAYVSLRPAPFWQNLFYSIFVLPAQFLRDVAPQDSIYDYAATFFLSNIRGYLTMVPKYGIYAYLIIAQYLLSYLSSLLIQIVLLFLTLSLGIGKLFIIPSCCFYVLASMVFIRHHHVGILFIFYIFILWQIYDLPKQVLQSFVLKLKTKFTTVNEYLLVSSAAYLILFSIIGVNIYWSVYASAFDYRYPYDASRAIASFIKKENLEKLTFWVGWEYYQNGEKACSGSHNINAYFSKNHIQNLNGGHSPYAFLEYRTWDKEIFEHNLRQLGEPDLFFGDIALLNKVFYKHAKYVPIQGFRVEKIYKTIADESRGFLFIREDLLSKYSQLHSIDMQNPQNNLQ